METSMEYASTTLEAPASQVAFHRGSGRGGLSAWLATPADIDADAQPLVAVHGIKRGARRIAEAFGATAVALGRPVIAPEFTAQTWPSYQQVVHRGRADLALLNLMQEMRLAGIWGGERFDLFGYSGGGQFAHRFAMLYPNLIGRLTTVAAGWYTFPGKSAFPYGFGSSPKRPGDWGAKMEARLDEFLGLEIQVPVGAMDCERDDRTRTSPELDRQQGANRLERASRWCNALRAAAEERGLPEPAIQFAVLPGSGHSFAECMERGGLGRLVLPDPSEAVAHRNAMRRALFAH